MYCKEKRKTHSVFMTVTWNDDFKSDLFSLFTSDGLYLVESFFDILDWAIFRFSVFLKFVAVCHQDKSAVKLRNEIHQIVSLFSRPGLIF